MLVCFDMPHVFAAESTPVNNAVALRSMLDLLIKLNTIYLQDHAALPLYKSGVVYGRTNVWDTIPALYERRYGDCKSLSAALIAEYRKQGILANPVFRFVPNRRTGVLEFHILVQTTGGFEDPSKVLGMGLQECAPVRA